jgi:RNA polymerase sigma-70 factor, ECF subfamily
MNSTSTVAAKQQDFADSVAQYLPYLNRFVANITARDQIAEDVVQQTVLKALTHADQFRSESTLKTWLTSIAVNEVRQAYRVAWRSRALPLLPEPLDRGRCQRPEFSNNNYEENERGFFVRNAVSQLPEMYRTVVELCDLQCVPMREAARKLGLTLSALKSRRHRARTKLRRLVRNLNGS